MWSALHIVFICLSLVLFLAGFILGGMYLVSEHRIKTKKEGGIFSALPSLERLDELHSRALYVGFVFFTVGIVTGGGWSKATRGVYLTDDPRQLMAIFLWIFYALLLNMRVPRGWTGRKGIVLSIVGFVAVVGLLVGFLK